MAESDIDVRFYVGSGEVARLQSDGTIHYATNALPEHVIRLLLERMRSVTQERDDWKTVYAVARETAVFMEEERDKAEQEAEHAEARFAALRAALEGLALTWEVDAGASYSDPAANMLDSCASELRALLAAPPQEPQP